MDARSGSFLTTDGTDGHGCLCMNGGCCIRIPCSPTTNNSLKSLSVRPENCPSPQFQKCQASDQTRLQLKPPILFIRASPCLPWLNFFRKFSRPIHPLGDLGSLATIHRFEDLECWQVCRELRSFVARELVPILPADERFRLADQILRSARSTTASGSFLTTDGTDGHG
jgi:hypothetical protein